MRDLKFTNINLWAGRQTDHWPLSIIDKAVSHGSSYLPPAAFLIANETGSRVKQTLLWWRIHQTPRLQWCGSPARSTKAFAGVLLAKLPLLPAVSVESCFRGLARNPWCCVTALMRFMTALGNIYCCDQLIPNLYPAM